MAVTENLHTGNGSKTNYAFTFPYLKTTDIKASVDGTVVTNFTAGSPTATEIQFNTAPANNAAIRIYRDTATDNLSATFYAGSAIKSEDLNDNFLQNLYVTQEAKRDASSAWQDGDETINSSETWHTSDDTKIATTKAIENRIGTKIDTALTSDVSGGDGVTITDNSPGTGQIRVDLDSDIATLKDMQSGAATQLAALTSTELAILDGATVTKDELNILDGVTATKDELNILDGVTATKDEINILDGVTATKDEINILDGVTATKDEINILDGVTATKDEINILDGVTATKDEINILDGVTATKDEINILDGVTATKDEINILDGVTATKDELNILDGVTATKDEINILDGVTATKDELNILDGVTADKDELNKTDGLLATTTELNVLDGVTANTSELNKLDGVTASTDELNIVDGKTFKDSTGTLDTTSDTEIPSSKVIAAHVASSQTAIGGFTTIADEVSFPNTQPANGVVVSINNAAGLVVNGSGVSTSGKRVDNTTVTINGFPSSLNGETLAAGVGLIVVSTSTANTYNYHKILTSETDVKQLSDDINDFNSRYRIAGSAPSSNNDEGDLYFDTAANKMKVYNGTAWDDVASVGSFFVNTLSSSSGTGGGSATFNGNAYRFTLSNAGTSAQQHIVSVNGVVQKPNSGTSQPSEGFAISGNDIIFAAAPASGSDSFIITCGSSVSIGTPSANSVNSSHIIDGSIVNGDISSSAAISASKINLGTVAQDVNIDDSDVKWRDSSSNDKMHWKADESSLFLKDGVKLITGDSSDFQIFHNGTYNYFLCTTGAETIWKQSNGDLTWRYVTGGGSSEAIGGKWDPGAAWEFNYGASKKLETTSTGINITGNVKVNNSAGTAGQFLQSAGNGNTVWADATTPVLTTQGDLLYRDGSGEQRLPKGTAGQQLTMNSGATAPEWSAPAEGTSITAILKYTNL